VKGASARHFTVTASLFINSFLFHSRAKIHSPAIIVMTVNA